jgi:hypothetical protein
VRDPNKGKFIKKGKNNTIQEPELERVTFFGMSERAVKNKNFNPAPNTYTLPSHVSFLSYFLDHRWTLD